MDFEIHERAGGGINGSEITAIEAHIPQERKELKEGIFYSFMHFLYPTKCVASITRAGEWSESGWEHALPTLRERLKEILH